MIEQKMRRASIRTARVEMRWKGGVRDGIIIGTVTDLSGVR